jgi:GNAT superfamily N-acetyltransferase
MSRDTDQRNQRLEPLRRRLSPQPPVEFRRAGDSHYRCTATDLRRPRARSCELPHLYSSLRWTKLASVSSLVRRAYETSRGWLALGHERIASPHAWLVRELQSPSVYDANFAALVRAESERDIDALLAQLDEVFAQSAHRYVFCDVDTPQPFEARLVLDGWQRHNALLTLVLVGEQPMRSANVELRPATSDADWNVLEDLHWLDHQEEFRLGFHKVTWDRSFTANMVRAKRCKAPAVQYFIARVDDVDCGFMSGWPGTNGVGQIEDLFTRSDFRGRRIGSALIAACIDDARARGAGPVIVCARAEDTPKKMYAALGFRPLCVQHGYLKHGRALDLDPAAT